MPTPDDMMKVPEGLMKAPEVDDRSATTTSPKITPPKIELTGTIEEKTPGALNKLAAEIIAQAPANQMAAAQKEADAVVDTIVEAAMRLIGLFPREHRVRAFFLHFCGHTDGAENGTKIGATTAMMAMVRDRETAGRAWAVVKPLSLSGCENYTANVSQKMMKAFIERYAPGATEDEVLNQFAEIEKEVFPEFAEIEKEVFPEFAAEIDASRGGAPGGGGGGGAA